MIVLVVFLESWGLLDGLLFLDAVDFLRLGICIEVSFSLDDFRKLFYHILNENCR